MEGEGKIVLMVGIRKDGQWRVLTPWTRSSTAEQRSYKPQVVGSNPTGSTAIGMPICLN